jgi:hypothetical protein
LDRSIDADASDSDGVRPNTVDRKSSHPSLDLQYNIEFRPLRSGARSRSTIFERDDEEFRLWCGLKPSIRGVLRFSGEVELGYQSVGAKVDHEMNMWRAHISMRSPVCAGLYRSKLIAPLLIGLQHREAVKIGIDRYRRRVAWMSIFSQRICLPDFNTGACNRPSGQGQHLSLNLQEFSVGTSWPARRFGKVCRLICSSVQGIEGPKDLIGRSKQRCRATSYVHSRLNTLEGTRGFIVGA